MYPYEQFAKLQNGLLYIKTKSVSFYLSLFIYSKIYLFVDLGSVYVGHSGQDCAGLRHLREEEPGQGILQVANLRQTFFSQWYGSGIFFMKDLDNISNQNV